MRFFLLLLALGLLPLLGADRAADTGAVRGGVIDAATKRAVEYATVTLRNKTTGDVVRTGVTDAKGAFILDAVPLGNYDLVYGTLGTEEP